MTTLFGSVTFTFNTFHIQSKASNENIYFVILLRHTTTFSLAKNELLAVSSRVGSQQCNDARV